MSVDPKTASPSELWLDWEYRKCSRLSTTGKEGRVRVVKLLDDYDV